MSWEKEQWKIHPEIWWKAILLVSLAQTWSIETLPKRFEGAWCRTLSDSKYQAADAFKEDEDVRRCWQAAEVSSRDAIHERFMKRQRRVPAMESRKT